MLHGLLFLWEFEGVSVSLCDERRNLLERVSRYSTLLGVCQPSIVEVNIPKAIVEIIKKVVYCYLSHAVPYPKSSLSIKVPRSLGSPQRSTIA